MARNYNGYFTRLRDTYIIGYIDHLDVVHSESYCFDEHYVSMPTHDELFGKVLKGWRWSFNNCLDFSLFAQNVDAEDCDRVRQHLTKKYKIPFRPNGYHDINYFIKKMKEEEL